MLRLRTLSELAAATFSRTRFAPVLASKHRIGVRHQNTAAAEPFLNGSSSIYIEEMYSAWQNDPSSVHSVSHLSGLGVTDL